MDAASAPEIGQRIKEIIGNVSGLDPARIDDGASLRQDLNLDSLTLLEISVEVDLVFKLELQDERYKEIDTLPAMVALVRGRLAELAAVAPQPEAVPG